MNNLQSFFLLLFVGIIFFGIGYYTRGADEVMQGYGQRMAERTLNGG